jgi:magnesium-transporting ATPase (P-type)
LFLHGREAYRRNSFTTGYMFYKNVLFVFPMFFYGFQSCFSGTPIYNNYLYQVYNMFFTGMPIMWWGIMDFEFPRKEYTQNVKLYKIGFNDEHFNKWVFWRWIFYGIWQGALIFYVAFDSMEYADPEDGSAATELVMG